MTQTGDGPCPVCKLAGQRIAYSDGAERLTVTCLRCGRFTITATAARMAESRGRSHLLSAWIRDATEDDREIPEINSRNLDTLESTLPSYSVTDKQLLLLRAVARKSKYPGHAVEITPVHDFPLAWASNEDELGFYLRTLDERGLLRDAQDGRTISDPEFVLEVTSNGWEFLEEQRGRPAISDQAFVAMSFSDTLKPQWLEAIAPAITDAGYKPYRVDSEPHIDRIDAKIVTEIRNSRFVVADVTEHKAGVYFEAGYAMGIGLPVIWTVRDTDLARTHFDTRQFNHIVWRDSPDLREQLFLVICAVIGKNR